MVESAGLHPPSYEYVRSALGMVVGLGIATVLSGMARFMQHPKRYRADGIHLGWAAYMLLSLVGFWWWEQGLVAVKWDFSRYAFVMTYAVLLFVMCALLFPQDIDEYGSYRAYFLSRRKWFFSLMALAAFVDVVDTLLKGRAYFDSLGVEYPVKSFFVLVLAGLAASTERVLLHRVLVAVALIYQISWLSRMYAF